MSRYIDADALKERKFPNGESAYVTGWNDAISAIMTFQPTVDAEPVRHGKWLWLDGVRCSECNYKIPTIGLPNYCPNCGCRMDEE